MLQLKQDSSIYFSGFYAESTYCLKELRDGPFHPYETKHVQESTTSNAKNVKQINRIEATNSIVKFTVEKASHFMITLS